MSESALTLGFLGRQLAKHRKIAGFTQAELAVRSKVSRATIASIENGTADPKLTTIIAICEGISPNAWGLLVNDLWMSRVEMIANVGGEGVVTSGCSSAVALPLAASSGASLAGVVSNNGAFSVSTTSSGTMTSSSVAASGLAALSATSLGTAVGVIAGAIFSGALKEKNK